MVLGVMYGTVEKQLLEGDDMGRNVAIGIQRFDTLIEKSLFLY